MNVPPPLSVRVFQPFSHPAERVFEAWLDPALIGRWMFGPAVREEEIIRLVINARMGGAFSFLVRREGREIDHVGTFLELVRPTRLAFTWGIAPPIETSRVLVDLTPLPDRCELTLTHELHPAWAHFADRTAVGWSNMLGALAAVLDR
jgi:uncharacterized protein YndB with AHSA1/START domain